MIYAEDRVLAVAPCAKRFGVAIFAQSELIYFAVKTLKLPRTSNRIKKQVSASVQRLIRGFAPELIVIKTLSQHQTESENVQTIIHQIRASLKSLEQAV